MITMLRWLLPVLMATASISAQDKDAARDSTAQYQYVGARRCQMCHSADRVYSSWKKTAHAVTWENLSDKQKQQDSCLSCHITGTTTGGERLTGVQCEACHGPGSGYSIITIMVNREKALAKGLYDIDEDVCARCHNERIPKQFQPEKPRDLKEWTPGHVHAFKKKDDSEKQK